MPLKFLGLKEEEVLPLHPLFPFPSIAPVRLAKY
jgi:hypothetical protein